FPGSAKPAIDAEPTWADRNEPAEEKPLPTPRTPADENEKPPPPPPADAPPTVADAPPPPRQPPARALETLGAEFDELSQRLKRLSGDSPDSHDEPEVTDAGSRRR